MFQHLFLLLSLFISANNDFPIDGPLSPTFTLNFKILIYDVSRVGDII